MNLVFLLIFIPLSWLRTSSVRAVALLGSVVIALCASCSKPKEDQSIRYRHSLVRADEAETDSMIKQLEHRLTTPMATALDRADLAELYYRRSDLSRSEQLATEALAAMPSPAAALTLAKIANAKHRFRDAVTLAAHAKGAERHIVIATAYVALGELAQATTAANEAVNRKPTTASYLMRALVMQAQGRDADAALDFARAVEHEQAGDLDEAARLRALWARFSLRRGDNARANALLAEALRIVPEHPMALGLRGELALRVGDRTAAKKLFERAFAASRQTRFLIELARAQSGADADRTRAVAERLLRNDLEADGFGHQLELVELLTDRGRPGDLAEAISRGGAELQMRRSAEAHFQLARALAKAGRRDEARDELQRALATGVHDLRMQELAATL